jgi:hypothetical protein
MDVIGTSPEPRRDAMFRKLILAIAATAALGAAALAPTAASAGGWHGHHHGWHGHHGWHRGFGFYGPVYASGGDCYYVRRVVFTPYGKKFRRVLVCD